MDDFTSWRNAVLVQVRFDRLRHLGSFEQDPAKVWAH